MKSTGIIRSIDNLGRIVLPKELRTSFGITTDTPLEIFTEGDTIVLRQYHPAGSCVLCGDMAGHDMVVLHGKTICRHCLEKLGKL